MKPTKIFATSGGSTMKTGGHRSGRASGLIALSAALVLLGVPGGVTAQEAFEEARIYIEYNATDNDLGFHVFLDGEDWKTLRIINPANRIVFDVQGRAGYKNLGLTELFFEGAEPSLFEVPLDELLALFPPGEYRFKGTLAGGGKIEGGATLSHAVPAGPDVSATDDAVGAGDNLTIRWDPVTAKATDAAGGVFPDEPIEVVAYQVIVGSFQVTLPASDPAAPMSVTVPPEYVASLEPGAHEFEVLAIDASGNQTITSDDFTK